MQEPEKSLVPSPQCRKAFLQREPLDEIVSKDNEMLIGAEKKFSPSPSPPMQLLFFFLLGKYGQNEALELELRGSSNVGGRSRHRDWALPSRTPLLPTLLWGITLLWGQYILKRENVNP